MAVLVSQPDKQEQSFDYGFVSNPARIAVYDDLKSSPRVVLVDPAPTKEFMGTLAAKVYELAKAAGGNIPYTVIREITGNFIHARFSEVVVSVLDNGNTIRFADHGPGIPQKDKAVLPGFSSATEEIKQYIDGVGAGLPIAKEYIDSSKGSFLIEDNLNEGSVITVSLEKKPTGISREAPSTQKPTPSPLPKAGATFSYAPLLAQLSERERNYLKLINAEGLVSVSQMSTLTGDAPSTVHSNFSRLNDYGFISLVGKKRSLSELGQEVVHFI